MDFREAESRFLQLQENYQNRAISEESFFQSVSRLMVQDSRGVYWTIDPRTGNWLFYDGHVWQRSVPPTKEITDRIKPVPKHRRTTGWALGLSIGGLAFIATLFVAAVFAYRVLVVSYSPKVEGRTPSHATGESAPVLVEALPPVTTGLPSLVVLEGSADVRSGEEGPWRPVEGNPYLQAGQSVRTHAKGRVQLVFSNDAVAELGENTEVLLRGAVASSTDRPYIGLFLSYGDTWHRLDTGDVNLVYEVETPSARVVSQKTLLHVTSDLARETLLHVTSDLARETLVEVVEGAAVLSGAGQSLRLGAGQKARVGPGMPPALLLPVPLPTINFMVTSTVRPGG